MSTHIKKHVHLDSIGLEIGAYYRVFGIIFREGIPWYLLCADIADDYPTPFCQAFFELTDAAIDAGWNLSISPSENVGDIAILPKHWAEDERFLERLVDGENDAVSYFNELKAVANGRSSI